MIRATLLTFARISANNIRMMCIKTCCINAFQSIRWANVRWANVLWAKIRWANVRWAKVLRPLNIYSYITVKSSWIIKLVYAVVVLTALVYTERRLIEPRLTGARLSALVQAALVYTVLVYTEWIQQDGLSVYTDSLRHLPRRSSKNCDLQFANNDRQT